MHDFANCVHQCDCVFPSGGFDLTICIKKPFWRLTLIWNFTSKMHHNRRWRMFPFNRRHNNRFSNKLSQINCCWGWYEYLIYIYIYVYICHKITLHCIAHTAHIALYCITLHHVATHSMALLILYWLDYIELHTLYILSYILCIY